MDRLKQSCLDLLMRDYDLKFKPSNSDIDVLSRMQFNWKPLVHRDDRVVTVGAQEREALSAVATNAAITELDSLMFGTMISLIEYYNSPKPPKRTRKAKPSPNIFCINTSINKDKPRVYIL